MLECSRARMRIGIVKAWAARELMMDCAAHPLWPMIAILSVGAIVVRFWDGEEREMRQRVIDRNCAAVQDESETVKETLGNWCSRDVSLGGFNTTYLSTVCSTF